MVLFNPSLSTTIFEHSIIFFQSFVIYQIIVKGIFKGKGDFFYLKFYQKNISEIDNDKNVYS